MLGKPLTEKHLTLILPCLPHHHLPSWGFFMRFRKPLSENEHGK
jgi:hypothetical protein